MSVPPYAMKKNLGKLDFQQALDRTTAALKESGFGVITEIDARATFKKKLDVEFPDYRILGACNPPIAKEALTADPMIGLMLPCNVVVYAEPDETVSVAMIDPEEVFKMVDNPAMSEKAGKVKELLSRALERL